VCSARYSTRIDGKPSSGLPGRVFRRLGGIAQMRHCDLDHWHAARNNALKPGDDLRGNRRNGRQSLQRKFDRRHCLPKDGAKLLTEDSRHILSRVNGYFHHTPHPRYKCMECRVDHFMHLACDSTRQCRRRASHHQHRRHHQLEPFNDGIGHDAA